MALTTYSELQTAMADWLNRSDMTTVIPDLISLFEAEVERKLRVRQMLIRAVTDPEADEPRENLPGDYLELKTIQFNSNPICVPEYRTPAWLRAWRRSHSDDGGTPQFYSIEGSELLFDVTPSDVELEILYYQKIPRLSGSQTTNWLLDEAPDLYLFGSLKYAAPYLKDDERIAMWDAVFSRNLNDLKDQDSASEINGPPIVRRPRGSY